LERGEDRDEERADDDRFELSAMQGRAI